MVISGVFSAGSLLYGIYSSVQTWLEFDIKLERFSRGLERWSQHAWSLPSLSPGQSVLIQNQYGKEGTARRWDRSGTVIEDLGCSNYRIRVDGSGRLTERNRQFLRKFPSATSSEPPVSVTRAMDLPDITEPSQPPRQTNPPNPENIA